MNSSPVLFNSATWFSHISRFQGLFRLVVQKMTTGKLRLVIYLNHGICMREEHNDQMVSITLTHSIVGFFSPIKVCHIKRISLSMISQSLLLGDVWDLNTFGRQTNDCSNMAMFNINQNPVISVYPFNAIRNSDNSSWSFCLCCSSLMAIAWLTSVLKPKSIVFCVENGLSYLQNKPYLLYHRMEHVPSGSKQYIHLKNSESSSKCDPVLPRLL